MTTLLIIIAGLMGITLIAGLALWVKMTFFRREVPERDLEIAYLKEGL